ncbi:MAG: EboA domain-containing protein [Cytophagales bacterium]|nr:EboA domain-containing protein [Cytophagales bacterium]
MVTDLFKILEKNVHADAYTWVSNTYHTMCNKFTTKDLYITFGMAYKYVPNEVIDKNTITDEAQLSHFKDINLTSLQLSRIIILLSIPVTDLDLYKKTLYTLIENATHDELQAIFTAYPLLPHTDDIEPKFAQYISTNMTDVFERMALYNPYPAKYLNQNSFNQMVIKTLFVDKNINHIIGLQSRITKELSHLAIDYAAERSAAGRLVRPEMWQLCICADKDLLINTIHKLHTSKYKYENEASILLLQNAINNNIINTKEINMTYSQNNCAKDWNELALKYPFSIW